MTSLLAFFVEIDWNDVAQAALDTLTMLAWSLGWTVLLGLPLGIVLYLIGEPRLLYAPRLYRLLSLCVNVLRSLPFIILLIVMIPVTTLLTGTSLGVEGTIPPLVAGCAPFFARLVETALREVEHGLVEASWSMGGSTWQLIWHTLLPESRAGLIAAVTVTAILLVDYTSMAGVIGGGGLGDLAIRFGYQRFQTDVMVVTVLMLIALVQLLQMSGDRLVRYVSRK
ncbi:TPA: ABC transporter permease [Klebsiella variicola]|nr:ABC transporter permease [Klebsiella variicola]